MKNTDQFAALRERLISAPKFAARADEILSIVRGKEPLRAGMPVEVERANKRTAPNGAEYHVRIRASTDSIARDAGIVPMTAWERGGLKNFNANPVILAFHNHREPIGIATYTELEAERMNQYWLFHEESETSRMMKSLYEKGFMRAASVGFLVHEWQFVDEMTDAELENLVQKYGAAVIKDVYWIAKRAELLETSAVPVPSDPNALAFDFAARNAVAAGMDISEIARIGGRTIANGSDNMPGQTNTNPEASGESVENTNAEGSRAEEGNTDPLAEIRTLLTGGFEELRASNKALAERIDALEKRGTGEGSAAGTSASGEGAAAATGERSTEAQVKIEVEKLDGESDEDAINRHVDAVVRKMVGAPVPTK